MKSYHIRVLVNSLCMSPLLTPLDATISGLMPRSDDLPDLSNIIANYKDVPMASYPIFEVAQRRHHGILKNVQRHYGKREIALLRDTERATMDKISGSKSPTYHRGSSKTITVPKDGVVDYYFTGDLERVLDLINRGLSIGAWTGKGFGSLLENDEGSHVIAREVDYPLCGILDPQGKLIRPVPMAMTKELGITDFEPEMSRYQIPYTPYVYKSMNLGVSEVALPDFARVF